MSALSARLPMYPDRFEAESRDHLPVELHRLLDAKSIREEDAVWTTFVARYSGLLLRVAASFTPGYDDTLDRYAFMLVELRKSDYRRLRAFSADGRGRFSTWLAVVARRLCLDHYRQHYGRSRGEAPGRTVCSRARAARRELQALTGFEADLAKVPTPAPSDPVEELDERERRRALRRAIGQLPPGDQLLVQLRFNEGLTAREIALLLGLDSPFHVYRKLNAIYETLRSELTGVAPTVHAAGPPHAARGATGSRSGTLTTPASGTTLVRPFPRLQDPGDPHGS